MATKVQRWETKPLDCFAKAKEIREAAYERLANANKEGTKLVACWGDAPLILGFEHLEPLATEAYAATLGTFEDTMKECNEVADDHGFSSDLCPYIHIYLGSMFTNKGPWQGNFARPDIVAINASGECAAQGKFGQILSEQLNIPYFAMDSPRIERWLTGPEPTPEEREAYIQSMMNYWEDYVRFFEKQMGQPWNWEAAAAGMRRRREVEILFSKICLLNQAVPAPLDTRHLYAMMPIALLCESTEEGIRFYNTFYDEVKWRIENKIAALATERCRLMEDNIPHWYNMRILRHVNKWGATFVVCPYLMTINIVGCRGDRFMIPPTYEEEGFLMRTREEVLRCMAESMPSNRPRHVDDLVRRAENTVRDWKVDAAILRDNKACMGSCMGALAMHETAYVLKNKGIPAMVYQTNQVDKRHWNEAQVIDRLEAFLEGTLGLDRLEK